MGIDKGFDFYPPLTDSDVDKAKWAAFLDEVKDKYKNDDNMAFQWGAIVFKQGEHPCLELDGHHFRRFSAKISGSHHGNVEKYLDEIKIIAKRHFGWRVHSWNEMDHLSMDNMIYGWDEVYAARKEGRVNSK